MKILRTRSGSLYCIETMFDVVDYQYKVITGYRVVLFSAGQETPTVFDHVDDWAINNDNHLVLIKDHKWLCESTSVVGNY